MGRKATRNIASINESCELIDTISRSSELHRKWLSKDCGIFKEKHMPNKLHDIFRALTFIGTGEHLPSSGRVGDVFATPEGKSYVYINHDWTEMGIVNDVDYEEDEEYITQEIVYIK